MCRADGILQSVVHRADRYIHVEKIPAELVNASIGTVADQCQTESDLPQPVLGDGEMEQYLIVGRACREDIIQSSLGGGGLLVDELATDVLLVGQTGDCASAGQSLHANREPLARSERL